MTIRAPFNFVPVSDKVFFPDWADQISHDIPFSDGLSGTIELEITAESPIFVRNGHTEKEREENSDAYKSFSNVDGNYFIPGTSLKGAIRNVMEIMSFGKMNFVDNKRYSLRDLQLHEYMKEFQQGEVHCGWMIKEKNKVKIFDHGIPFRVSHDEIDYHYNTDLAEIFEYPTNDFFKKDANKSSLYKYHKFEKEDLNVDFEEYRSETVVDKRKFASLKNNGSLKGRIVFTGQPGKRRSKEVSDGKTIRKGSGKFYEFIFPYKDNPSFFELDYYETEGKFYDFKFIYKNSTEWKYWVDKMCKGEKVPIFFLKDNNGELKHFGLSYLYKLPFIKKIKEFLPEDHLSEKSDMAECIFGYTKRKNSLRGRVSFGNCFAKEISFLPENVVYMGSPMPTYYPIYVKQEGNNGFLSERRRSFTTLLDRDAQLKGWKRYPIQKSFTQNFNIPDNQLKNSNAFVAAKEGSVFTSKVRFLNLKPVELGLLLQAIKTNEYIYHNIGFAKPHGYGKVKVDVTNVTGINNEKEVHFIKLFNELINNEIEGYRNSEEIKELNLLRRTNNVTTDFSYMELEDFVKHKKHNPNSQIYGEYLEYLSNYIIAEPKQVDVPRESTALVTLVAGQVIKVKLEGEEKTYDLEIPLGKRRPKQGKKVKVEIITKGGNIHKIVLK